MKRELSALLVALLIVAPVHGQVVTDPGVTAGISAQLTQGSAQIANLSNLVKAAKTQLETLEKVSSGIRKLQAVMQGGVQGLLGEAADKLGLKDVFMVGKQLQSTFNEGMQLYRDVRDLPVEAKRQLEGIGLAVSDLKEYLSDGLVYDAFQGMDIADWQKVFKNPMDALAQGALGRACDRTEAYTDTTELRKQYAEKLANMTPEERAKMSGSLGLDMGVLNFTAWSKEMEKRIARTVNFSVLADKLGDAVGGKGQNLTVTEQMKAAGAVSIGGMKVQIEAAKQANDAAQVQNEQLMLQTNLERRADKRASAKEDAEAMLSGPP